MASLTESEKPDLLAPHPLGELAGDHTDDDGQAIDDYFIPNPGGPGPSRDEPKYKAIEIPSTNRWLKRRVTVGTVNGNIADPVQVFPADPNRTTMKMQADGIFVFGTDKSDVYDSVVTQANATYSFDSYTGAIWVYSTAGTPVNVNVWTVTQ